MSAPARRVLVADGEACVRRALSRLLEQAGYRVGLAADAADALAELRREPPDLVLIDVDLPGGPGLRVLADARRGGRIACSRVVLLTRRWRESDWAEAARRGAEALVCKPFSPADLLNRIRDWTAPVRSGAAAEVAAAGAGRPSEPEV
jgi:two-component system KDP operon response regulator KdpE